MSSSTPARRPKASWVAVAVSVVCAVAVAAGHDAPPARLWAKPELWSYDGRFHLRGPEPASPQVVLVVLDDKTLREAPELLQRRAGFAAVLDAIAAGGAKVVAVDAFFAEAEAPLAPALVDDVRVFVDGSAFAAVAEPAASLLRRVRDETRGDEVLEQSLASVAKNSAVVLAMHSSAEGTVLDAAELKKARFGQLGAGSSAATPGAPTMLASLPRFALAASAAGLATVVLDDDQVGRRLAAARVHNGATVAPMAVHAAARMLDLRPAQVGYLPGSAIALGAGRVPLTASKNGDTLLLRFRGPQPFTTFSAVDVVRGAIPKDALQGRAVLVGFTYLTHDSSPTPFDGRAPGLEIHATALDNILAGEVMRRSSSLVDGAFALLLGLLAALSFSRFGPGRAVGRLLVPVVLATVAVVVGQLTFNAGVWLAVVAPAATAVLASSSALVTAYITEGAERRQLRKAFAHYLADEIIDELMANPQTLALGGARRDVSLLFSDIRGFTSMSEKMAPEELSTFLNTYLTPMTRAVLRERGFLDKYIGDAVMAVFGAPAPSQDRPDRALAAALAMHLQLVDLRKTLHPELNIGVGINTGDAVAGNMGSAERFDYTVIGDAVNLASRLESLTKTYAVFCIVGDNTRQRASADFSFREIDLVRVKGRERPEPIYELLAGPGHVVVDRSATAVDFASAVDAFRSGDFSSARQLFAALAAKTPADTVVALYVKRLVSLGSEAPAGWVGVFEHTEK